MNRIFPMTSSFMDTATEKLVSIGSGDSVLFVGDNKTCKTSLLFQSAVSFAAEGCHVTYISCEPLSQMPSVVHGMPHAEPAVLKTLKMLYMSNKDELVNYLAAIHQAPVLPQVVVVDDLHHYTNQVQDDCRERTIAKLSALLTDVASLLTKKSEAGSPVHLLVATRDQSKNHLPIYEKFFSSLYAIKRQDSGGSTHDHFSMSQIKGPTKYLLTFRFYIKDCIFLKEVLQT